MTRASSQQHPGFPVPAYQRTDGERAGAVKGGAAGEPCSRTLDGPEHSPTIPFGGAGGPLVAHRHPRDPGCWGGDRDRRPRAMTVLAAPLDRQRVERLTEDNLRAHARLQPSPLNHLDDLVAMRPPLFLTTDRSTPSSQRGRIHQAATGKNSCRSPEKIVDVDQRVILSNAAGEPDLAVEEDPPWSTESRRELAGRGRRPLELRWRSRPAAPWCYH